MSTNTHKAMLDKPHLFTNNCITLIPNKTILNNRDANNTVPNNRNRIMNIESNISIIEQYSVPIPDGSWAHLAFRNEKTQSDMGSMILGNWVPVFGFRQY